MLVQHTLDTISGLLAQVPPPTPTPTTAPPVTDGDTIINTGKIVTAIVKGPLVLILVITGVIIAGRARRGRTSEAITTSGHTILGLMFIAGATALFTVGDKLVNLIFG